MELTNSHVLAGFCFISDEFLHCVMAANNKNSETNATSTISIVLYTQISVRIDANDKSHDKTIKYNPYTVGMPLHR